MIKARRTYLIIFLSFICISFFSQTNLVPNPSFETYTTCPSNVSEIGKSIGWDSYGNSPDYYNTCATFNVGVPNNWVGHQIPSSGNAYSGVYTYGSNYREYLGMQLTTTLTIGLKYFVSFKVNRCDNSAGIFDYASNKHGAKFSTVICSQTNPSPTNNFAHVYTNSIITDSINWTLISGSLIADSSYQYITLGNFFDDTNTNSLGSGSQLAYYYFDDICVSTDSLFALNWTVIKENSFLEINSIYPNPANNNLYMENFGKNEKYEIINMMGTIVKQGFCNGNKNAIDVSDLNNGLYFVMVREKKMKLLISH